MELQFAQTFLHVLINIDDLKVKFHYRFHTFCTICFGKMDIFPDMIKVFQSTGFIANISLLYINSASVALNAARLAQSHSQSWRVFGQR